MGFGAPTGGTWTIDYNGEVTSPLNWNATALEVQTALCALPPLAPDKVSVSGSTWPVLGSAFTVEFADLGGDPPELIACRYLVGGVQVSITPATLQAYDCHGLPEKVVIDGGGATEGSFTINSGGRDINWDDDAATVASKVNDWWGPGASGEGGPLNIAPVTVTCDVTGDQTDIYVSANNTNGNPTANITQQGTTDSEYTPEIQTITLSWTVLPAVADVKDGVFYGAGGTEFEGEYAGGGGGGVYPAEAKVDTTAGTYGPTGVEYTPSLNMTLYVLKSGVTLPADSKVDLTAGNYGYSGNVVVPLLDLTSLAQANVRDGVTIGGVLGNFTHTTDYTLISALVIPAAGKVDTTQGDYGIPGSLVTPTLNMSLYCLISTVVAADWVVTGHVNRTGGDAGTYPTTATTEADQLATDQAAVLAQAASIVVGVSILGQAGSYPTTAASKAEQLVDDQAAVLAAADVIALGETVLGQPGALDVDALQAAAYASGAIAGAASQLTTDQAVVLGAAGSIIDTATILGQAGALDSDDILVASGGTYVVVAMGNVRDGVYFGPSSALEGTLVVGPGAAPTLTIVNNGDGTATATIAGGDAAAANTVYVQLVDPNFSTRAWTSAGTRTGNGTVTLTLANGPYFVQVRSAAGAVSQAVYFAQTDGTASITDQIADAVVARLRLASLPSITDASIVKREWEAPRNLPSDDCVLVCPIKLTMPWQEGTTANDDVGYDFAVVFLKKVGTLDPTTLVQAETLDGTSIDLWGHRIEKTGAAFRQQSLAGVPGTFWCAVEPFKLLTVPQWAAGRWVSGLILRFKHRETRGLR